MHQFDKVEMFSFVAQAEAVAEHERLLAIEEEILQGLGIPYRVVNIAVDDLGSSAAKKYDLEAWLPSQQRFRELTSTSNTTDFQARRLDIRHRPDGGKPEHVHTLNGTAVAVGRTLIALMENHQTADGGVEIPTCCGSGARLSAWVDLEGAVNVRDLGGLPLEGGGTTASGVLLRSDNLQGLTRGRRRRGWSSSACASSSTCAPAPRSSSKAPGRWSPTGGSRSAIARCIPRRAS